MTSGNIQNGNGNRHYWWAMGLAATMIAGGMASTLHTIRGNAERVAVLESQERDTRRQLERIEHKVDQILESGRHK